MCREAVNSNQLQLKKAEYIHVVNVFVCDRRFLKSCHPLSLSVLIKNIGQ